MPIRRHQHAFTLVELLVVITIIALLIAMLLPVLKTAKQQSRQIVCLSNHHQLIIGLFAYAQDFNGYYPARYPILSADYNDTSPNYLSNYGSSPGASTWWSYHDTFVQAYLVGPQALQCAINPHDPYRAWPVDTGTSIIYAGDFDIFAGWYAPLAGTAGVLPTGVTAADFPLRVTDAPNSPLTSCLMRDLWNDPTVTIAYHFPDSSIPRPPGIIPNPYGYSDGSVQIKSTHTPYYDFGWGYGYWAKR